MARLAMGTDYIHAFDDLGFVDKRLMIQSVDVHHSHNDVTEVSIKCVLSADALKELAEYQLAHSTGTIFEPGKS